MLIYLIEVVKIVLIMVVEIGVNVEFVKRGGLFYDIGKVFVNEIEIFYVIVGGEFIKKFGEK